MSKPINIERLLDSGDIVILYKNGDGLLFAGNVARGSNVTKVILKADLVSAGRLTTAAALLQALAEKALGDEE